MMNFVKLSVCATALSVAMTTAEAAGKTYGVEITPGGKHYAVLRDAGEQLAFAIYAVDDPGAKPAGVGIGKNEVEEFEWGGDDHILLRISGDVAGIDTVSGVKTLNYSRWLTISRLTGEFRTIFGNEQGSDYFYLITSAGALVATLPGDSDRTLFSRTYAAVKPSGPTRFKDGNDELLYSLIEANLRSGDVKRKLDGKSNTIDWIVTADGDAVARIDQNESTKSVEIHAANESGKGFQKVVTIPGETVTAEQLRFYGVGSSPRKIQVLRNLGGGAQLFEYDLDVASYGPAVEAPGAISNLYYDPRAARARFGTVLSSAGERPFHIDPDDQKTQLSLEKALGGAAVSIVSKSADGARMIARADYTDKGSEFYLYDKPAKRLELIAAN